MAGAADFARGVHRGGGITALLVLIVDVERRTARGLDVLLGELEPAAHGRAVRGLRAAEREDRPQLDRLALQCLQVLVRVPEHLHELLAGRRGELAGLRAAVGVAVTPARGHADRRERRQRDQDSQPREASRVPKDGTAGAALRDHLLLLTGSLPGQAGGLRPGAIPGFSAWPGAATVAFAQHCRELQAMAATAGSLASERRATSGRRR